MKTRLLKKLRKSVSEKNFIIIDGGYRLVLDYATPSQHITKAIPMDLEGEKFANYLINHIRLHKILKEVQLIRNR